MPAGYLLPRADREQRELKAYSRAEYNDDECDWLRCSAVRRGGKDRLDGFALHLDELPGAVLTGPVDSRGCQGKSGGVCRRTCPSEGGNP